MVKRDISAFCSSAGCQAAEKHSSSLPNRQRLSRARFVYRA